MKRAAFFAALAAVSVGAFVGRSPAQHASAPSSGEPEIVAATFASAWCSSCKVLTPTLARVIPEFADAPVDFVEFDFTFGARDELKAKAARSGLADLYERNKGAAGFTLLVDADTGEILDTLTMHFSGDAMRSAIVRALAVASYTDERPAQDPVDVKE